MAATARTLRVRVVIDTICPWCYVGKRRIDKAIELAKQKWPGLDVSLEYMPYQLDPGMGRGIDKLEMYQEKFGSRASGIFERLAAVGREDGIELKFGGKVSNTLDSHRLIDYAKLQGGSKAENKVIVSLLRRYFEQEQDIGDIGTLVGAATDAALDPLATKEYLLSTDGVEAIKARIGQAKQLGVTGVPFYIINDRFGVSGAEMPETLLAAFEKALDSA
ncbi:hypothetical protein LPJ61_004805 [Coemansia biformis]|uniref:DSBA-like thioredoxin domain-containing protein n=1 Tax=Coemansia biformis TaxID=1286918 RepID=A0A9W7Y8K7_9FUNG|nr:hypothetical protein LPJ61_004805 [Coemansia biformis]